MDLARDATTTSTSYASITHFTILNKKASFLLSLLLVCHNFVVVEFVVFVAPPGLEPGMSGPKPGVLPLHHGAKACAKIAKRK